MGKTIVLMFLLVTTAIIGLHTTERYKEQVDTLQIETENLNSRLAITEEKASIYETLYESEREKRKDLEKRIELTNTVAKVTAYTASFKETGNRKHTTASNMKVKPGIIAVSRDLYKKGWTFGKKVQVKDLGVFEIQDLMHPRMVSSIDIYMEKVQTAREFGKQTFEVTLLN